MRRTAPAQLLAIAALVCSTGTRPAAAIEDVLTPRAIAMGDSLIADASGALGPLLNPAGMTLRRSYTIEAMYGFRVQDTGSMLTAAIIDSVTSKVSAGVFYTFVHGSPHFRFNSNSDQLASATREGHETGLALALPLGDYFSFGITTKYTRIATTAPNPAYDPVANPTAPPTLVTDSSTSTASADGFTLDVGTSLRLGDSFALGVVGYNLVPLRSIDAPIALGTGAAYHLGTALTIAADFVVDFNKYRNLGDGNTFISYKVGGGLEWLAGGKVAIRAGSYWDGGRPATYISAGLAYVGQSFAVDVAYKQEVQHGVDSTILAGVRVFLQ